MYHLSILRLFGVAWVHFCFLVFFSKVNVGGRAWGAVKGFINPM